MLTVFLFLLIPTVLLVIFTYIPAANMIGYSFEERDHYLDLNGSAENFVSGGVPSAVYVSADIVVFFSALAVESSFSHSELEVCGTAQIPALLRTKARYPDSRALPCLRHFLPLTSLALSCCSLLELADSP